MDEVEEQKGAKETERKSNVLISPSYFCSYQIHTKKRMRKAFLFGYKTINRNSERKKNTIYGQSRTLTRPFFVVISPPPRRCQKRRRRLLFSYSDCNSKLNPSAFTVETRFSLLLCPWKKRKKRKKRRKINVSWGKRRHERDTPKNFASVSAVFMFFSGVENGGKLCRRLMFRRLLMWQVLLLFPFERRRYRPFVSVFSGNLWFFSFGEWGNVFSRFFLLQWYCTPWKIVWLFPGIILCMQ